MTFITSQLKTLATIALLLVLFASGSTSALAQSAPTTTTLSNAAGIDNATKTVIVASATNIYAPGLNPAFGGIGSPQARNLTLLYIDRELLRVNTVSGTTIGVERGYSGTKAVPHNTSATIYVGPANLFVNSDPTGACVSTNLPTLPVIAYNSGTGWTCPTSGPNTKVWTKAFTIDSFTFTDGNFIVPPAACNGATTGTAGAGNDTLIVDGSVPALKVSSTNAAGSHAVFTCFITVPSRLTANKGVTITDVTYYYSVQTTTATSMVASTLNTFTAPAAGTAETASSATLVAAGGSLTQLPVVASANLTAVSAGQYYSEKVSLGTPYAVNTDGKVLVFTFEIDQSASAAQIVTTPGLSVHYVESPL